MRTREAIEKDGTRKDILTLEVLLDIRELMLKYKKVPVKRKRKPKIKKAK